MILPCGRYCSPLGLYIIANSVRNGHITGPGSTVFKSGQIGKWEDQTTIEEYSWMI